MHYPNLLSRQKSETISDNCDDHKKTGRDKYMNIDPVNVRLYKDMFAQIIII